MNISLQKKWSWSPNHNKWKHANASVQNLLTTLKSREEDRTHQCKPPKKQTRQGIKCQSQTDFTSYLIDVVWDGRLRYNCTDLTNDCSYQRATEWGNTEINMWHQDRKWNYPAHGEESDAKQRLHKAKKDNMTYIKEQRSINGWPCVHQVYLVVQLGLVQNSCINRTMVHLYFQGHPCGGVMSAVPYISSCIFSFAVFF